MRVVGRAVAGGERRHCARHWIVLLLEEDRDVVRLNLSKQCALPSQSKVSATYRRPVRIQGARRGCSASEPPPAHPTPLSRPSQPRGLRVCRKTGSVMRAGHGASNETRLTARLGTGAGVRSLPRTAPAVDDHRAPRAQASSGASPERRGRLAEIGSRWCKSSTRSSDALCAKCSQAGLAVAYIGGSVKRSASWGQICLGDLPEALRTAHFASPL
jgi:hypothetical protein